MKGIREILENTETFILATHVNPDADGLGSMLAMHLVLRARGLRSVPLVEETPPGFLDFLHGFEDLVPVKDFRRKDFPVGESVALVFDLSEADRLGEVVSIVQSARERIVFDHHDRSGDPLPGLLVLEPGAPATALLVFRLLRGLCWAIPPGAAENLYAGLYSDTGGFRFEKTGEESFLVAAELVRLGARPAVVGEKLLENHPPARFELMKRVLERREWLAGGRGVLSFLTLDDFEEAGCRPSEAEDLATFLRSMRGVEVAVVVKEIRPGEVGVSLRSRGAVDVAELAASEGGGGHRRAAGFRKRDLPLEKVLSLVREKVTLALEGL